MNLSTSYLGLKLNSPFIVGASPFCDDVHVARKLQDAGAGAVVMRSLFAEQFAAPPVTPAPAGHASGFPAFADYQWSPDQYLRQLQHLKANLTIPVIASLNGHRPGAWLQFARRLADAGADAIELNFHRIVADPGIAGGQVETEMLQIVAEVAGAVHRPVAVKLAPFHTSIAQLAMALEQAGASGLVLFNRFYQPDVDTENIAVSPSLHLSEPGELLLRLRWLAILSPLLRGSLAAGGGVHNASDVVKALLTGADAVQVVSVLLRHGPHILATLRGGLELWMREHGHSELGQFGGQLNLQRCREPAAFERANYIRVLQGCPG